MNAPRSGASKVARGTPSFAYPWKNAEEGRPHSERVRGFLAPRSGCGFRQIGFFQAYAKNAYAWLISQHASGVLGSNPHNVRLKSNVAAVIVTAANTVKYIRSNEIASMPVFFNIRFFSAWTM